MTNLQSPVMADSRSDVDAAAVPSTVRFCGDVMLRFQVDGDRAPSRGPSTEWTLHARGEEWTLWVQETSKRWRGYPLSTFDAGEWRLWLLGERYDLAEEPSTERFLSDVVARHRAAARLNGHLLLFAWNGTTRQWHIWTDRFGTLHAYYGTDGRRAALGTFFPAVAASASRRQLDWAGLTGFFGFGFFPQDRTFFEDVRILRPASHYVLDQAGILLQEERYWSWRHEPDRKRSYDDTVAEFGRVLGDVLTDQVHEGRVAIPISGGLDSRTTVSLITQPKSLPALDGRLWSYSYGYSEDSIETRIAKQVAAARGLPFQSFTIGPYLFDRLDLLVASVEGFQDVTQSRQAAVSEEIRRHSDYLIAAHWGDVWLDDTGLVDRESPTEKADFIIDHTLNKIEKHGREWLLKNLCRPRLNGSEPETLLRDFVRAELARIRDVEDADFRVKAFKTDQWSFRWTVASLRMFQPGAFPRLPFFDTRIGDFFATVPSEFVSGRRLQIDFLKQFAPDLARIRWQAYDANLFWYPYFNSWLLPKRALRKAVRVATRKRVIERNWEVQFMGEQGRDGLKKWLTRPTLRLYDFVSARAVEGLIAEFQAAPFEKGHGYAVSMLLTLSAWLECHG